MQTLTRRSAVPSRHSRRGLTILEFLVLLVLLVQILSFLIPSVQRVQDAASKLNAHPVYGPFAGTVGDFGTTLTTLGDDTRSSVWQSILDGEIDITVYQGLNDRYTAAIALASLLAQQTQACIDTEEDPLVDLQLFVMREAILQCRTAVELAQPAVVYFIGP